jgi:apolipoprotein N-acyltransferase
MECQASFCSTLDCWPLLCPGLSRNFAAGNFQRSGSWVVTAFVLLFIAPVLAVSFVPDSLTKSRLQRTADVALTVVQPNISQIDKYAPGYDAINFRRLAEHSQPRHERPRLILWPEAAIPWRLEDGYPFAITSSSQAKARKVRGRC